MGKLILHPRSLETCPFLHTLLSYFYTSQFLLNIWIYELFKISPVFPIYSFSQNSIMQFLLKPPRPDRNNISQHFFFYCFSHFTALHVLMHHSTKTTLVQPKERVISVDLSRTGKSHNGSSLTLLGVTHTLYLGSRLKHHVFVNGTSQLLKYRLWIFLYILWIFLFQV